MFDISWGELLIIGMVALVVIGPKELPGVLRTVGQWMAKVRRMAAEFQDQFREAMREAGVTPVVLEAKEGLALINGTQMMTAVGSLSLLEAENVSKAADIAAAQAVEALRGTKTPYLSLTHELRPHPGQLATARTPSGGRQTILYQIICTFVNTFPEHVGCPQPCSPLPPLL